MMEIILPYDNGCDPISTLIEEDRNAQEGTGSWYY